MDRSTFDRLVVEHLPAAQRFAVRLAGGDASAAEDVLHDAIVRAARAHERFRGDARFTTWWFAIIVNAWRDRLDRTRRDAGPMPAVEPDDVRPGASPPARASAAELSTLVAARVGALPPRQREVLVLIAYERLSIAEAARVLGTTEGNVRTNLSIGRARLRRELADVMDFERSDADERRA